MVSDCFDAIPIPRLGQHCTGWQSAARVHSALYLEYHRSWGHSGYLGGKALTPLSHLYHCLITNSRHGMVGPQTKWLMSDKVKPVV